MSKYLDGYSYGGERPSILAAPSHRRLHLGDDKCPCCGGNSSVLPTIVCSTCKRDALLDPAYARKVAAVEARLQAVREGNAKAAAPRNRVEAVIPTDQGYWAEQLLNPAHPENLGRVRCIGGKIEDGETPEAALIRELAEEYELIVLPEQLRLLSVRPGSQGDVYRVCVDRLSLTPRRSTTGHEQIVFVRVPPDPV